MITKLNGWNVFTKCTDNPIVNLRFTVLAGSEKEDKPDIYGVSHFVEHLIFKGTKTRSSEQITNQLAMLGGRANAYTSKTFISYYIDVINDNWVECFKILTDMFCNSIFDEEEIEKERKVIIEEFKTRLDDPEIYAYDEAVIDTTSCNRGHRVIGDIESIKNIKREDILNFINKHYRGDNILISLVGDISNCGDRFNSDYYNIILNILPINKSNKKEIYIENDNVYNLKNHTIKKPGIKLNHLHFIFKSYGIEHVSYTSQQVLLNALGGGMYSLLFKRLREDHGLCYSTWCYELLSFTDNSLSTLYVGMNKDNLSEILDIIHNVIEDVTNEGLSPNMLEMAKINILSDHAMDSQTSSGIAASNIYNILINIHEDYDIFKQKIRSVNNNDIKNIANSLLVNFKEFIVHG